MPLLYKVAGARKSRGTRSDYRYAMSARCVTLCRRMLCGRVTVGDKTLYSAYRHRLELSAESTAALTLCLLRADSAADRGQRRGLGNDRICVIKSPLLNTVDEVGNMYVYGAGGYAGLILTREAALCLGDRKRLIVAERDLAEVATSYLGRLNRHFKSLWNYRHLTQPPLRTDCMSLRMRGAQKAYTFCRATLPRQSLPHSRQNRGRRHKRTL